MSDYTVDNLEIKIQASADKGILAMENLLKVTERVQTQLEKMATSVNSTNKSFTELSRLAGGLKQSSGKITTSFKDISAESAKTRTEVSSLNKELDAMGRKAAPKVQGEKIDDSKAGKNFNTMFNVAKVVAVSRAVYRLGKMTIGSAIDMTESYNLFNVAMGDSVDKAEEFQQTLTSALGVNISESRKYQGFFKALASNMNIASDSAYVMSENLTKLIYDLSSLYNIDVDVAYGKIQSGMIGQTKPLRELGVDITAQTLQGYIDDFGWETQIQSMTQAEKVMLRYIAILDQTRLAQGDFARTIEAPATQLRILKQQLAETAAWIGTAFLGAVVRVMPYLNAFLTVLKEISKAIAAFFGFNIKDFGFGGGSSGVSFGDMSAGIDDVGSGIGNIGKEANKAKKQVQGLLSLNEINNITTPTATSGGSGGGGAGVGAGGFADLLADKLGDYDNLMGNISTKAQEISKNMMEWLGFTKTLSGWKWGGFKDMATSAKILSGLLGGIVASKFISFIWGGMEGIAKVVGGALLTGFKAIIKPIDTLTGGKLIPWLKNMSPALTTGAIGVVALAGGMKLASEGGRTFARENEKTAKSAIQLGAGIGAATAGGALLGSVIPGVGTAIGAVGGFAVGSASALFGYRSEMKKVRLEAELFDGMGIPLEDYTGIVVGSMNAITGAHAETIKWTDAHKKSEEVIGGVITELELMQTKMTNSAYKVTVEDIKNLSSTLERMGIEVEASGEAFTNATVAMTDKLVEEGKISRETADTVVANAIRKAEAEGNFLESYKIKMNELTTSLENGKISQEEYRIEVKKLNDQFNETMNVADDFKFNLDLLTDEASKKINLGNWKNLETSIDDITSAYDVSYNTLKEGHISQLAINKEAIEVTKEKLKEIEKASGKENQAYKDTAKELEDLELVRIGLTETYAEESVKLDGIIATSFGSIITQLHSTGQKLTPEAQAISDNIVEILSSMGYEVDFETGIVSRIKQGEPGVVNAFGAMGDKSGKALETNTNKGIVGVEAMARQSNPIISVTADTKNAVNNTNSLLSWIGRLNPKLNVGIQGSGGLTLSRGGGGSTVMLMADGGLPSVGQHFIAREAGPELVGNIGRSSAVVNNDQIVQSVSQGVAQAVAGVMSSGGGGDQPINLYLPNGSKFASWVVDEIDNLATTTGKRFRTA